VRSVEYRLFQIPVFKDAFLLAVVTLCLFFHQRYIYPFFLSLYSAFYCFFLQMYNAQFYSYI